MSHRDKLQVVTQSYGNRAFFAKEKNRAEGWPNLARGGYGFLVSFGCQKYLS